MNFTKIIFVGFIVCGVRPSPGESKYDTDNLDLGKNINLLTTEGSGHGKLADVLGLTDDEDSFINYRYTDYTDHFVDRPIDTDTDINLLTTEGSGHGKLAEALGLTDDEDNFINYRDTDYTDHFVDRPIDEVAVQCFNCHGGDSGCDVIAMQADINMHSLWCYGKCLNISHGPVAVYQCADDMTTQFEGCLENDGTIMCFCSGNFCNFPSQNLHNENDIAMSSEPSSIPNTDDHYKNSTNNDNIDNYIASHNNKTVTNVDHRLTESKYLKEAELKTDNSLRSKDLSIHVSDSPKNRINRFPFVFKRETHVIIPRHISATDEEQTHSKEDNPSRLYSNHRAVGNLRYRNYESCAPLLQHNIPILFSMFVSALVTCVAFS